MYTDSRIEFDRQAALEKAMGLFWRYGYEATSLSDLLEVMGIGRQSLYNSFGSKHSLFLETVTYYNNQITQSLVDTLEAPGSGLENIKRALEKSTSLASRRDYHGCFLTNSIVELAPHDPEVRKIICSANKRVINAFKTALERAVNSGEVSPATDPLAVARFLNACLHGIVVAGKASQGKDVIEDIAKVALASL